MKKLIDLPWLPSIADDWVERCKLLDSNSKDLGSELRFLASFQLDISKSIALRRTAAKLKKAGGSFSPLSKFRLGIVAANTFDMVIDCLPAAALRHGVALETVQAPYGMIVQSVVDPGSVLYTSSLDGVLIAADHRWLGLDVPGGEGTDSVEVTLLQLEAVLASLRQNGGPPAIVQTLATPISSLFGSFDTISTESVRSRIAKFNSDLIPLVRKYNAYIMDVAGLAAQIGTGDWFNPVQWAAYKLPFDAKVAPIYAEWLGRLLGAIRGKAAKCLVLDLDNTLWGGVIGDDGLDGIVLGQGSARGEAHLAVQRTAMNLRSRGIFLAVASKNEMAIALEPFRSHPDMLLKESDISVFQANWIDKATNLETIAKTLNIGLDSLVLLDDNPAERAQVRHALPMVGVPELPEDPSWFAWLLEAGGWFEAVTFSAEDATRVSMLAEDSRRAEVMASAHDLTAYLRALNMTLHFAAFDSPGRQRIVQLINKTNQFNLTTRRYTELQVRNFETNSSAMTLQLRLADRFGDLGMIAVVICEVATDDPTTWNIDTWLMSCRVLGRSVEAATLSIIAAKAAGLNVRRLVGTYIPTNKNALVESHYAKLGFTQINKEADGKTSWELNLSNYTIPAIPMKIVAQ